MKEVKLQIRIDKQIKDMWVKEASTLGMTLTDLIMDRMGAGVSWRGNDDTAEKASRRKYYHKNAESEKKRILKRRLDIKNWYKEYKLTLKCKQCGESNPNVLEFHHKDPSVKEIAISLAVSNGWSKKRILEEIDKCEVLCSNCHKKVHVGSTPTGPAMSKKNQTAWKHVKKEYV